MPKKIEMNDAELLRMHRMGATLKKIAIYFGCSCSTPSRRLRKLGIYKGRQGKKAPGWKGGELLNSDGYAIVMRPNHLRADITGYVKRSIVIWEAYHDLPWPEDKEPHHQNEDKLDDDPKNVKPLTHSKHISLHAKKQPQDRKGFIRRAEWTK